MASLERSPAEGEPWRFAAWAIAGIIVLLPLAAMPFTDYVHWTTSDFLAAGVLLFVPLGIYELTARRTGTSAYRAGVGLALAAAVLLLWVSGAVGITDSGADGMYIGALAVGVIGASIGRFGASGMARAMFATALAVASSGVIALVAGGVPAHNAPLEILAATGLFAVLFAGSALLFRHAARRRPDQRG